MRHIHLAAVWKLSLPMTQKMALAVLGYLADEDGRAETTIAEICKLGGMCERSVQRALSALESKQLVRRDHQNGRATIYHLATASRCASGRENQQRGDA